LESLLLQWESSTKAFHTAFRLLILRIEPLRHIVFGHQASSAEQQSCRPSEKLTSPKGLFQQKETLRIFFTIGSLEIGGTENQLALLAGRLFAKGHFITVFSFQNGGPLKYRLERAGVTVITGGMKSNDIRRKPWKLLLAQFRLLRAIRKGKPQVVHAYLPLITFLGALAAKIGGTQRIVTSRRALGNHQDRYPVLLLPDLFSNMLSDFITVNSAQVGEDMIRRERIGRRKIVRIYNGIDTGRFPKSGKDWLRLRRQKGLDTSRPIVITVANLIPYKGHEDLIRAAKIVIGRIPDVRFLLVGEDRGIQNDLETIAQQLKVQDCIVFLGMRNDVPELLAASNLFVLPSLEEGFSNSLLEAMAAGLPVVATAVGGNPEAVIDGKTGWLVPARDANALAERIIDLLICPQRAKKWGRNGRKRVMERFSVEVMVAKHLFLYCGQLADKRRFHRIEHGR